MYSASWLVDRNSVKSIAVSHALNCMNLRNTSDKICDASTPLRVFCAGPLKRTSTRGMRNSMHIEHTMASIVSSVPQRASPSHISISAARQGNSGTEVQTAASNFLAEYERGSRFVDNTNASNVVSTLGTLGECMMGMQDACPVDLS